MLAVYSYGNLVTTHTINESKRRVNPDCGCLAIVDVIYEAVFTS
jgi:hypothetical protein